MTVTCFALCQSAASATPASSSTVKGPAWSQSSCCPCLALPLFDGNQFFCGADHSRCENACKHLCFETNEAVVRGCGVLCVVVRRCEVCKHLLFCRIFSDGGIVCSSKGNQIEDVYDGFGPSFSTRQFQGQINLRCPKHMDRGLETQSAHSLAATMCVESRRNNTC